MSIVIAFFFDYGMFFVAELVRTTSLLPVTRQIMFALVAVFRYFGYVYAANQLKRISEDRYQIPESPLYFYQEGPEEAAL